MTYTDSEQQDPDLLERAAARYNDNWTVKLRREGVIEEGDELYTINGDTSAYLESPVLDELYERLTHDNKPRGSGAVHRYRAFRSLVRSCFQAIDARPGEYVGVLWPTATDKKPTIKRYGTRECMSPKSRKPVVELLVTAGYLKFFNGWKNPNSFQPGIISLVLPTDKMDDLWESVRCQPYATVQEVGIGEVVLLKDTDKRLIDYEDTPQTERDRRLLRRLASVNRAHCWTYQDAETQAFVTIPARWFNLHRIYREGRLDRGGRLYCAAQQMAKEDRRTIKIDGEETVELDYEAMSLLRPYLHMLRELPDFPQDVPWLYKEVQERVDEGLYQVASVRRDDAKLAANVALNVTSPGEALGPIIRRSSSPKPLTRSTAAVVRDVTVAAHPLIGDYFYAGRGGELEFIESQLMVDALEVLVSDGIPLLPIHDGILCRERDRDRVLMMMEGVIVKRYGIRPIVRHNGERISRQLAVA